MSKLDEVDVIKLAAMCCGHSKEDAENYNGNIDKDMYDKFGIEFEDFSNVANALAQASFIPKRQIESMQGKEIRSLRKSLGLNQQQFWLPIGVTQSGGSRYESGRDMPEPVLAVLQLKYMHSVEFQLPKAANKAA